MARSGSHTLDAAVVQEVLNSKTGRSRVVAVKGQYTITIEKNGAFPDGMHLGPDDTIDVAVKFDQRVKP